MFEAAGPPPPLRGDCGGAGEWSCRGSDVGGGGGLEGGGLGGLTLRSDGATGLAGLVGPLLRAAALVWKDWRAGEALGCIDRAPDGGSGRSGRH